jgi:hypothetical protein
VPVLKDLDLRQLCGVIIARSRSSVSTVAIETGSVATASVCLAMIDAADAPDKQER